MPKVIKCSRCGRRTRDMAGWNGNWRKGVLLGHICPTCQTPMENAEAEINEATLFYYRDSVGVPRTIPKALLTEMSD